MNCEFRIKNWFKETGIHKQENKHNFTDLYSLKYIISSLITDLISFKNKDIKMQLL